MDRMGSGSNRVGSHQSVNHSVQGNKEDVASESGQLQGKKVKKHTGVKARLKAMTSPFSRLSNPKTQLQRSVSLPDISSTPTTGLKKSASQPNLNELDKSTPVDHPKQFSAQPPAKDPFGGVDMGKTANNVIQQLDVMVVGVSKRAASQKAFAKGYVRLDPKTLGDMIAKTISKSIAAENLGKASERLAYGDITTVNDIHDEIKKQADGLIDSVVKAYPKLAKKLKRENFQEISRTAQYDALKTMQKEVWVTKGPDKYAEDVAPNFERLAEWAANPEGKNPGLAQRFKPVVPASKPVQKKLRERSSVITANPLKTQASPKEVAKDAVKEAVKEKTLEQRVVKATSQESEPPQFDVKAFINERAEKGSAGKLVDQLKPELSKTDVGWAMHLYASLQDLGASRSEAAISALAYKDAVVQYQLTGDQALSVGREVYNWQISEQDYPVEDIKEAGRGMAEWVKSGVDEDTAIEEMTRWLDKEASERVNAESVAEFPAEPIQSSQSAIPVPPPPPAIVSAQQPAKPLATKSTAATSKRTSEQKPAAADDDARSALMESIRAGKALKKVESQQTDVKKSIGSGTTLADALSRSVKSDAAPLQTVLVEDVNEVFSEFFYDSDGDLEDKDRPQLLEKLEGALKGTPLAGIPKQHLDALMTEVHKRQGDGDSAMKREIAQWVNFVQMPSAGGG